MRGVQLDHVEAGALRHLRSGNELRGDRVHVGAVHRLGSGVGRCPWNGRGGHRRPVADGQRRIDGLPAELGRTFAAAVADLAAQLGMCFGVHERGQARPRCLVLRSVEAGTARRDASFGRDAGHLRVHQPCATFCPLGVVDEVPIGGAAVDSLVLRHRGDNNAVDQVHAAQRERCEHRRAAGCAAGVRLEPILRRAQPLGVTKAQVLVRDALRTGE